MRWHSKAQFDEKLDEKIAKKSGSVAALITNCNYNEISGQRLSYIRSLRKYVSVDILGKGICSTGPCPTAFKNGTSGNCKEIIGQEYKFFLSFENSICRDYITEKFFEILSYDIVPIVMGGGEYNKYVSLISFLWQTYNTLKFI